MSKREYQKKWYSSLSNDQRDKKRQHRQENECYRSKERKKNEFFETATREHDPTISLYEESTEVVCPLFEFGSTSGRNNDRDEFIYERNNNMNNSTFAASSSNSDQMKERGSELTQHMSKSGNCYPTQPLLLSSPKVCPSCKAKKFAFEWDCFCCSKGTVVLKDAEIPELLYDLYMSNSRETKSFRKYSRIYNNMFAFTSMGVTCDDLINKNNKGIYTFRVQGQLYHSIRASRSNENMLSPLEMYFIDTEHEVLNRTRENAYVDESIVEKLMLTISSNPYAIFFRQLKDQDIADDHKIQLKCEDGSDQRTFNAPTVSQVAAIWTESSTVASTDRYITILSKSNIPHEIKHYYGCYDPLQYPLLFPYGDNGWHNRLYKSSKKGKFPRYPVPTEIIFNSPEDLIEREHAICSSNTSSKNKLSCREYYAYQFQIRESSRSILLHSGRLLQQYSVDMYLKIETTRLDYYRNEQKRIRADLHEGVVDSIISGECNANKVGKRVILPANFIGGPRDMRKRYVDAMSLVQRYGKPDIFLTFTCNPSWPEIKNELKPGEEVHNRPDLATRIFRSKLEKLKELLFKKHFLGPVSAYVEVIEFQKRGLPHAHFLIILQDGHKIVNPEIYDHYVLAEIPDKKFSPYLFEMVTNHMMHGPCGSLNPKNSCMIEKGKCKFKYPKPFSEYTTKSADSYPLYRRRKNGISVKVRNHLLDNAWVVPYNPTLLALFNCHVNVEVCSSIKAVKYLYKSIYKGHDRVAFQLYSNSVDEIANFQAGRWISAPEAMWRIFAFPLNGMYPPVISLQLHLPNKHTVTFKEKGKLDHIICDEIYSRTTLTEFFKMNERHEEARTILYRDFPESYVWQKEKIWTKRKTRNVIGRVNTANPAEGERYYLRLLLNHITGPTSFNDLLTVDGVKYSSFREAAEAHNFLESDNSIFECLTEAISFQMPSALRRLFATVLAYCEPANCRSLWNSFYEYLSEDFKRDEQLSSDEILNRVLTNIHKSLESMGKKVKDYNLPQIAENIKSKIQVYKEILEERNVVIPEEDKSAYLNLNTEQLNAYNQILQAIDNNKTEVFFIDGPGGTGKTYLYRAILATVRSKHKIAIATASSGVAASGIPGGRTAHSRFKLPIEINQTTCCNISKQSGLARLLRQSSLIIWDEASMARQQYIEALNETLQDINECDLLFGGKVVVFGGDFRQVLPVIQGGTREEIISESIVCSKLWPLMQKIKLTQNMRAARDPLFAAYLLRIGDGSEKTIFENMIKLPSSIVIERSESEEKDLIALIDHVFPYLEQTYEDSNSFIDNAILTPRNEYVNRINETLIEKFPGPAVTYYSFDTQPEDFKDAVQEEILNELNPAGLPPHRLTLKIGSPIMLLRNLDPSIGLCNGTRLICKNLQKNILDCEILVGTYKGTRVLLPRIPLQPAQNEKFPIKFIRKQFPIRLAFAMTINKSQGQTLERVGIHLPEHGQLYVALSRAKTQKQVKILLLKDELKADELATRNVVYKEIFAHCN